MLASLVLGILYGVAYLVTGQACAIAYYQPQPPDMLYKARGKEDDHDHDV